MKTECKNINYSVAAIFECSCDVIAMNNYVQHRETKTSSIFKINNYLLLNIDDH